MSDGRNEARALRILEIANDFRTLQVHISSHVTRATATPPDAASQNLDGYRLLQMCRAEGQRLLAHRYEQGALGLQPGAIPETAVQQAQLQRIILDVATRRFQAHRVYLRAAAGTRWVTARTQVLQSRAPNAAALLQAIDQRLRQEVAAINDQHVVNDLRAADVRKGYWIAEDPSLERMVAWARTQ